jgi:hypothetical protein
MGIKLGQLPKGGSRPQAPEGNHLGICVRVYDMGTQNEEFEGKPKQNRKLRLGFELPDERAVFSQEKGEQPFIVDLTLNIFTSEKSNFMKMMTAWLGKAPGDDFDLEDLVGKPAMVNVAHKESGGKVYANVASLAPVPKAMLKSIPTPDNKPVYWSVENGKDAAYDKLPDFLKGMANQSIEWNTETPDDAAASKKEQAPDWEVPTSDDETF